MADGKTPRGVFWSAASADGLREGVGRPMAVVGKNGRGHRAADRGVKPLLQWERGVKPVLRRITR